MAQETSVDGEEATQLTLFDTGPDTQSLVRNIKAMQVPIERITRVVTSHWHSDHTGGLLSFLSLRSSILEQTQQTALSCIVDVHPDRPIARGIAPGPTYDKVIAALPFDPTFEDIQKIGGVLEKHSEGHFVAEGTMWVSGEIPRVTEYETGLLGGMRWVEKDAEEGQWISENVSCRVLKSYRMLDVSL